MQDSKMIERSVGVHSGAFHADEVTACALLLAFDRVDREKIVRSRDVALLARCEYVCDVGGVYDPAARRFDHHQASYSGELSSAGMVWLHLYGTGVVDEATYRALNHTFLLGVDAHDNGRARSEEGTATFSHFISSYMPPVYDAPDEVLNAAFLEAVDCAEGYIRRVLHRFAYTRSCKEQVARSMEPRGEVLYFDQPMPWMESFFELGGDTHPARFVVMPSGSQWKVRGIPPTLVDRMSVRQPLPAPWAGLLDGDLARASGIPGAVFCHKGRFISVWRSREDALRAVQIALGETS